VLVPGLVILNGVKDLGYGTKKRLLR